MLHSRARRWDAKARRKTDIEQCGHLWRRDLFVEKIETAVGLFENALGRKPLVFRTGALAQSPELYGALPDATVHCAYA